VNTPTTHGATDEEAAKHRRDVLEMVIEGAQQEGEPLSKPRVYAASV
jgi:predicted RNase H-like HicB family nuclease